MAAAAKRRVQTRAKAKTVKKARRGKRLTKTGKYDLVPQKGKERGFTGTLLRILNVGKSRIAIFSIPKVKPRA